MHTNNSTGFNRRTLLERAATATGLAAVAAVWPMQRKCLGENMNKPAGFKYAICNETFGDWPFEKAWAFAAECGYTGIEIAPFTIAKYVTDIPAKRRTELRQLAEKCGLKVVGLHWLLAKTEGFHLTSPDVEIRNKTARYFAELACFCAELGGSIMVLGSPKQRDLSSDQSVEDGLKNAADVLGQVVPTLEQTGVTIALEPLAPSETNFLNTAADATRLMHLVNSPYCRLLLDCKAMSSETTPIPILIRKHADSLVHFHANDPNLQGPGFGKLDFTPIMQALDEINYQGWVSVEVFDYSPGVERLARESLKYMRRCTGNRG